MYSGLEIGIRTFVCVFFRKTVHGLEKQILCVFSTFVSQRWLLQIF
jgi:hypothetical protein